MDCAIVGFDLSGDALLVGETVALREGLTVLYGGNGAGKTRLLQGIGNALLGIQSDFRLSLIVTAPRPTDAEREREWGGGGPRNESRPLLVALAQALAPGESHRGLNAATPVAERTLSLGTASQIIDEFIREEADANPALLTELLETRFFLMSPTGTATAPSWDAWPVANRTLPEAARVVDAIDSEYHKLDHVDQEDYEEANDRLWEFLSDAVLIPAEASDFTPRGPSWMQIHPRGYLAYGLGGVPAVYPHGMEVAGNVDFGLDTIDFARPPEEATTDYIGTLTARLLAANSSSHAQSQPRRLRGIGDLSERHETTEGSIYDFEQASGRQKWRGPDTRATVVNHVERAIRQVAKELETGVTRILAEVLLDAPIARLRISDPVLRLARAPVQWLFERPGAASAQVGLGDLSHAEQLWSRRAILEALYWHERENLLTDQNPLRPTLYLYDEPEAALHRAAEAHMAQTIVSRAKEPRRLIVATHSPELLDTVDAHVLEVKRGGRYSRVHPLDLSDKEALRDLGLAPSDLLRWTRVFLVVEGEHDEVLLEHFLGPRLREARVKMIAQHGAIKLPHTVDSAVLFEHTEAKLVGLVDNERAALLESAWEAAKVTAKTDSVDSAVRNLVDTIGKSTGEAQVLGAWLTAALRKGVQSRVFPEALSARDIVEYLPVDRFVAGASSWESLHLDHGAYRAARKTSGKPPDSFKDWLAKKFNADFSAQGLRTAAEGVPVPQDMVRLIKRLEALSADRE